MPFVPAVTLPANREGEMTVGLAPDIKSVRAREFRGVPIRGTDT